MLGTVGTRNTGSSARVRNPRTLLDLDWVMGAHVNRSAVERRVELLPKRRSIKKDWQAAWLARAVTCIDLTTLAGDNTPGRINRLCAKAKQPIRPDMLTQLGLDRQSITVGAVCVYPNRVKDVVDATSAGGVHAGAFAYALTANMPVDLPALFSTCAGTWMSSSRVQRRSGPRGTKSSPRFATGSFARWQNLRATSIDILEAAD